MVVLTAAGDVESVVEAVQLGAVNFLLKPTNALQSNGPRSALERAHQRSLHSKQRRGRSRRNRTGTRPSSSNSAGRPSATWSIRPSPSSAAAMILPFSYA